MQERRVASSSTKASDFLTVLSETLQAARRHVGDDETVASSLARRASQLDRYVKLQHIYVTLNDGEEEIVEIFNRADAQTLVDSERVKNMRRIELTFDSVNALVACISHFTSVIWRKRSNEDSGGATADRGDDGDDDANATATVSSSSSVSSTSARDCERKRKISSESFSLISDKDPRRKFVKTKIKSHADDDEYGDY